MAGQAADVFVSYKAEDRARVQQLVSALQGQGFSVWWDTHIGGGARWREDIQKHLDAAKCVIDRIETNRQVKFQAVSRTLLRRERSHLLDRRRAWSRRSRLNLPRHDGP